MLATLLPGGCAAAEAFGPPGAAGLRPAEAAAIGTAGPGRRAEFAAGRACARAALGSLGITPGPILPGRAGEPCWPPGVTGSITHCAGYRGAAVAREGDVAAIGIDAEPARALPDGLLAAVAGAGEQGRLRELAAVSPDVAWDRLLFCAKEAAFKAWFARSGQRPGFLDLTVTPVPEAGRPGAGSFT
ncbi:MAG: 4'-phosphopantetheinyl transferase superfamily protein, partial [Nocardiopsaceae bacterium]|nr:4'-phosphopantetheinyl transferase superfamily protein [Nocardiopsaceae bacterium]